jgi:hypothetical protein
LIGRHVVVGLAAAALAEAGLHRAQLDERRERAGRAADLRALTVHRSP